jgi:hypothetical protein
MFCAKEPDALEMLTQCCSRATSGSQIAAATAMLDRGYGTQRTPSMPTSVKRRWAPAPPLLALLQRQFGLLRRNTSVPPAVEHRITTSTSTTVTPSAPMTRTLTRSPGLRTVLNSNYRAVLPYGPAQFSRTGSCSDRARSILSLSDGSGGFLARQRGDGEPEHRAQN